MFEVVSVADLVVVQPSASVIVTVYEPAETFVRFCVDAPLLQSNV